jgi:Cdc6-like AAA superfamily ATPase
LFTLIRWLYTWTLEPLSQFVVTSFEELQQLKVEAGKVFQPRTPIALRELFAGRWNEIQDIVDAVSQIGLHVVIYGERGVGKTSLANIVKPVVLVFDQRDGITSPRIIVKANANNGDTFSSLWVRIFAEITWNDDKATAGLIPGKKRMTPILEVFDLAGKDLSADDVRRIVTHMARSIFVIDEFDRVAEDTAKDFTDLLKALSDFAVDSTVILVGVSDTVDTLVADHASITRALATILLPRMKIAELTEILTNAEKSLNVYFSAEATSLIVHISQGLPHYTHLVGLHSVRIAADRYSRKIERQDVFAALKEAVGQAEQTVRSVHSKAVRSAHPEALYRHVLLASAVAGSRTTNPYGYFNPSALVEPLSIILNRQVQFATFNNHLAEFCQPKRGLVLERQGEERSYQFRFENPLLVPFVFMDAIATGLISDDRLSAMLGASF